MALCSGLLVFHFFSAYLFDTYMSLLSHRHGSYEKDHYCHLCGILRVLIVITTGESLNCKVYLSTNSPIIKPSSGTDQEAKIANPVVSV